MFKYKYFFLPHDEAEIGAIEGWLESMADRGLKLTLIKGRFFGFEESSTVNVRYCIHPRTDDTSCGMHGWKYVGKLSRYFDIFITENDDVDKAAISTLLIKDSLNKQVGIYGTILFFLYAVLMVMLFIRLNFDSEGFISMLIDYDVLLPMGILAGFICAVVSGMLHAVAYFKREKRINLLMERRKQPLVKTHRIFESCMIALIIISLFIIIVELEKSKRIETIPLDKYTLNLNLPLMEQISPEEWYAAEEFIEKHNSDIRTNYSVIEKSRYVAPKILYVRQYWYAVQDIPDAYEVPFGYNVSYYEMKDEDLAIRYEKELCMKLGAGEMTVLHVDGFDSASYFSNTEIELKDRGEIEDIVLRTGNIIITAMYYGSGSLLDSVNLFSMATPTE